MTDDDETVNEKANEMRSGGYETKHQALSPQKTSIANTWLRVGMPSSFNCSRWRPPLNAPAEWRASSEKLSFTYFLFFIVFRFHSFLRVHNFPQDSFLSIQP